MCDFVEQSLVMQSVLKSCFESLITARTPASPMPTITMSYEWFTTA